MSFLIKSGDTDKYVYFSAPPGLSTFTVYYSRNGGTATQISTPTVNETSSSNMPGCYELLVSSGTTLTAGNKTEAMRIYVSATGWSGTSIDIVLYDNLPADINQVNGSDINQNGTGGQKFGI